MKFSKVKSIAYFKRHNIGYSESTPASELIKQATHHFKTQLSQWNDQSGCSEKVKLWWSLETAAGNLFF